MPLIALVGSVLLMAGDKSWIVMVESEKWQGRSVGKVVGRVNDGVG